MPYDGSGNYNRDFPPGGWAGEAAANVKIRSDHHDTHDEDLAHALSNVICKDGQSQPTADISLNGHHLINVLNPINPQDAATRDFVVNFRDFTTSITISGSDMNGQVIFSSATGANGLSWAAAGADLSFVARKAEASKTLNRWVFNNSHDASTNLSGDVLVIDENGRLNGPGIMTNNLSYDGAAWRTIVPGFGALLSYASGGDLRLSSNDIASITNPYMTVTLREFFTAKNEVGNAVVTLNKTVPISGVQKYAQLLGSRDGAARWAINLGDNVAESGVDRVGSDFNIYAYINAGTTNYKALGISRATLQATFGGVVAAPSTFASTGVTLILASAANGQIYFRPNGAGSNVEEMILNTNGDLLCGMDVYVGNKGSTSYGLYAGAGVRGKVGSSGGYSSAWMNSYWSGADLKMYANTSFLGDVAWQCDYRIKKDVQPLPSTWDAVKQLNPISYTQKAYDVWVEDDRVRWGFMAHELQEKLVKSAASGEKDGPEIQSPQLMVVIAALTKALQEAMARIEALEQDVHALEAVVVP